MAGAATIPVTVPQPMSSPARDVGAPKVSRISGVELISSALLSSPIAVTEKISDRAGRRVVTVDPPLVVCRPGGRSIRDRTSPIDPRRTGHRA